MTTTMILVVLACVFLAAYLIRREARLRWLRGARSPANVMLNLILKSTALAMGSEFRCCHSQGDLDGSPRGPA